MSYHFIPRFFSLVAMVLVISIVGIDRAQADWVYEQRDMMGTRIIVQLWADNPQQGERAVALALAEIDRLELMLSPYKPASELSKINREAAARVVPITAEMERLLDKSLYYSVLTDGAFDITFASLGKFYDYRQGVRPTAAQQSALLAAINYRHVVLDNVAHTVHFTHPDVSIDLGGIAKGYTVDRAIAILQQLGITHASISAGGDSRVLGDRRGRPWVVGIKNPRNEDAMAVLLPLSDVAISTSGDYERYFLDQTTGERVHHILNPRTGKSASDVMSVSILGPQGFDTDPMSTSVFVMGVDKGLALLNRLPGFDGVIISLDGKVHYSEGLMPPAAEE